MGAVELLAAIAYAVFTVNFFGIDILITNQQSK